MPVTDAVQAGAIQGSFELIWLDLCKITSHNRTNFYGENWRIPDQKLAHLPALKIHQQQFSMLPKMALSLLNGTSEWGHLLFGLLCHFHGTELTSKHGHWTTLLQSTEHVRCEVHDGLPEFSGPEMAPYKTLRC